MFQSSPVLPSSYLDSSRPWIMWTCVQKASCLLMPRFVVCFLVPNSAVISGLRQEYDKCTARKSRFQIIRQKFQERRSEHSATSYSFWFHRMSYIFRECSLLQSLGLRFLSPRWERESEAILVQPTFPFKKKWNKTCETFPSASLVSLNSKIVFDSSCFGPLSNSRRRNNSLVRCFIIRGNSRKKFQASRL